MNYWYVIDDKNKLITKRTNKSIKCFYSGEIIKENSPCLVLNLTEEYKAFFKISQLDNLINHLNNELSNIKSQDLGTVLKISDFIELKKSSGDNLDVCQWCDSLHKKGGPSIKIVFKDHDVNPCKNYVIYKSCFKRLCNFFDIIPNNLYVVDNINNI